MRALMSWDGQYMFARDLGVFDAGTGGNIYRVNMDGTGFINLNVPGGSEFDFAVTPTGIAYIAKQAAGECDHIYTAGPDGSGATSLLDLWVALQYFQPGSGSVSGEKCQVNAIHYSKTVDYFTVSDREKDTIVKVSGSGVVLETYGQTPTGTPPGTNYPAEGSGTTWRVQFGHHLYADDKLLVFSNGQFAGGTSRVLHYTLSSAGATLDWQYTGMGNSPTMGDAQALPNGNVLIAQSQGGNLHELGTDMKLVQGVKFSSLGYVNHRPTLYGEPPR